MTVFIFLGSLLAAMAIGVPIAYALLVMAGSLTRGPGGRILFPERSAASRNVPLTP